MQARTICLIFIVGAILAAGSCATLHAQDATMTDGEACTVVLSYLSGGFLREKALLINSRGQNGYIMGGETTPSGVRFRLKGKREREVSLDYKDLSAVERFEKDAIGFKFPTRKDYGVTIEFLSLSTFWGNAKGEVDDRLLQALNKFVSEAHTGYPYDCHKPLTSAEAAKVLADFQQKTAAWRAMNPKPAVSDEVTKKRMLAEDAIEQKNIGAAQTYYRMGVTLDPTWAPGWFNGALISAELKDYAAAALNMKHYLILLPDAPDAAAAKEKVLLWEAKAEQANSK
jgi:hypothetical protein